MSQNSSLPNGVEAVPKALDLSLLGGSGTKLPTWARLPDMGKASHNISDDGRDSPGGGPFVQDDDDTEPPLKRHKGLRESLTGYNDVHSSDGLRSDTSSHEFTPSEDGLSHSHRTIATSLSVPPPRLRRKLTRRTPPHGGFLSPPKSSLLHSNVHSRSSLSRYPRVSYSEAIANVEEISDEEDEVYYEANHDELELWKRGDVAPVKKGKRPLGQSNPMAVLHWNRNLRPRPTTGNERKSEQPTFAAFEAPRSVRFDNLMQETFGQGSKNRGFSKPRPDVDLPTQGPNNPGRNPSYSDLLKTIIEPPTPDIAHAVPPQSFAYYPPSPKSTGLQSRDELRILDADDDTMRTPALSSARRSSSVYDLSDDELLLSHVEGFEATPDSWVEVAVNEENIATSSSNVYSATMFHRREDVLKALQASLPSNSLDVYGALSQSPMNGEKCASPSLPDIAIIHSPFPTPSPTPTPTASPRLPVAVAREPSMDVLELISPLAAELQRTEFSQNRPLSPAYVHSEVHGNPPQYSPAPLLNKVQRVLSRPCDEICMNPQVLPAIVPDHQSVPLEVSSSSSSTNIASEPLNDSFRFTPITDMEIALPAPSSALAQPLILNPKPVDGPSHRWEISDLPTGAPDPMHILPSIFDHNYLKPRYRDLWDAEHLLASETQMLVADLREDVYVWVDEDDEMDADSGEEEVGDEPDEEEVDVPEHEEVDQLDDETDDVLEESEEGILLAGFQDALSPRVDDLISGRMSSRSSPLKPSTPQRALVSGSQARTSPRKRKHSAITDSPDNDHPRGLARQVNQWTSALQSLLKGKKTPTHQDLLGLKKILEDVYENRARIQSTSSLAETVYAIAQMDGTDIPEQDKVGLRAVARKSLRAWGIQKRRSA